MKLYAPDADLPSSHTQPHTVLIVCFFCLVSVRNALIYLPKGIAFLAVPDGFVFPFYSLSHTVSEHLPFFNHLLILIQRKPSGLHNRIFSFFLCAPHRSLPSHPLMSLSILHSSPSKLCLLTKGAPMLSQIGVEMGSSEIDKFHPRGNC